MPVYLRGKDGRSADSRIAILGCKSTELLGSPDPAAGVSGVAETEDWWMWNYIT